MPTAPHNQSLSQSLTLHMSNFVYERFVPVRVQERETVQLQLLNQCEKCEL